MGASPSLMGSGMSLEPSQSAITLELVTGSHVVTIDGYSHLKDLFPREFYSAGSFAAAGHRWSILIYPHGNEYSDPDTVAVYLRLDRTYATVDIKARFTLSFVDQSGQLFPSSIQTCIWTYTFTPGVQKGFPSFAKMSDMQWYASDGNDSIRIRSDITVVNLKETDKEDSTAKKFIVVPPPDMQHNFGHLLLTGEGADLKLEVQGQTFLAHRSILAARSPVFRALFFGQMKENTECSMGIEGIEARVFQVFLHYIYNDSLPEIEDSQVMPMAQHLLVVADRYDVERLRLICEDKLCNYIDISSVGTMLALADQHGCHGLKNECLKFLMSGNLKAALETDGFDHLARSCPSVLKELLAKVT